MNDVYPLKVVQMFLVRATSEPTALISQPGWFCTVERGFHGNLNDHLSERPTAEREEKLQRIIEK